MEVAGESTLLQPDTPSEALYDVAVVGAGLAGSTAAAMLAGHGWRVILLERDEFPRHKVCGEFLSPEAQLTLKQMGLYDKVAACHPFPLQGAKVVSPQAHILHRPLPATAWGLSRYALDATLAAAAVERGAELRSGTTVTRQTRGDGLVSLQLHHRSETTTIHARTAIMAFGRTALPGVAPEHAATRRLHRTQYVGAKAHYRNVPLAADVELYFFPGGYAGLNPVEQGAVNLCVMATYHTFAQAGRTVAGILQYAIASNPALAERVATGTICPETECAVAPVDTHRRAQPWGDFAQLGDSAVMLPPLCGDGMAMALHSAYLCAPLADAYLRGDLAFDAWEAAYRRAWSKEFRPRLRWGRRLQRVLQKPFLADGLIQIGNFLPDLADQMIMSTRGDVVQASSRPSPVHGVPIK